MESCAVFWGEYHEAQKGDLGQIHNMFRYSFGSAKSKVDDGSGEKRQWALTCQMHEGIKSWYDLLYRSTEVYWIAAIGPHWRYGEKDDGQDLVPLIGWHDTIHDAASYADLQQLVTLINALWIFRL